MKANNLISLLDKRPSENEARLYQLDNKLVINDSLDLETLKRRMNYVIALLIKRKVKPGDRVLLLYDSTTDFTVALFACFALRAIAVPYYPPLTAALANNLERILQETQTKVALIDKNIAKLMNAEWLARIPLLGDLLLHYNNSTIDFAAIRRCKISMPALINTSERKELSTPPFETKDYQQSDIALLQYTSGSTSHPKGVILTHGNILHNLIAIKKNFKAFGGHL